MYVSESFMLKSECMINCEFCFYVFSWVYKELTGSMLSQKFWLSWQSWSSRQSLPQQGGAGSHLALLALPGDNPRAPWGIFPGGVRAGSEPQVGQGCLCHLQVLGTRREQGGEQSIPRELLRGCTSTRNPFMGDLRMGWKPGWTGEEVPGDGAFKSPII